MRDTSKWQRNKGGIYVDPKDGREFVSVTTVEKVITPPALLAWMQKTGQQGQQKANKAADIGTDIHHLIDQTIRGVIQPRKPQFIKEALENKPKIFSPFYSWLNWWDKQGEEVEASERIVYSETFGYAGQLDLLTKTSIKDWKTSKRIYDMYHLQVCAYSFAFAEMTGEKPRPYQIVRIPKEEPYEIETTNIIPFSTKTFRVFLSALRIYRWQKGEY